MRFTQIILLITLFVASVGRAQVVLPSSSDYDDPYTFFRDCVSNNGNESESICEQQTGAVFPEESVSQAEDFSSPAIEDSGEATDQMPVLGAMN